MADEIVSTPRPLTSKEMELLAWLLEHGLLKAETFTQQVENIRATPWCECGCPSISLHVEEYAALGKCSYSLISDILAKTPDGKKIGVLLFQDAGRLSLLEAYSMDVIEGEWGFPVYESLQTWEDFGRSTMKETKE